eukprot:gene21179-28079_t
MVSLFPPILVIDKTSLVIDQTSLVSGAVYAAKVASLSGDPYTAFRSNGDNQWFYDKYQIIGLAVQGLSTSSGDNFNPAAGLSFGSFVFTFSNLDTNYWIRTRESAFRSDVVISFSGFWQVGPFSVIINCTLTFTPTSVIIDSTVLVSNAVYPDKVQLLVANSYENFRAAGNQWFYDKRANFDEDTKIAIETYFRTDPSNVNILSTAPFANQMIFLSPPWLMGPPTSPLEPTMPGITPTPEMPGTTSIKEHGVGTHGWEGIKSECSLSRLVFMRHPTSPLAPEMPGTTSIKEHGVGTHGWEGIKSECSLSRLVFMRPPASPLAPEMPGTTSIKEHGVGTHGWEVIKSECSLSRLVLMGPPYFLFGTNNACYYANFIEVVGKCTIVLSGIKVYSANSAPFPLDAGEFWASIANAFFGNGANIPGLLFTHQFFWASIANTFFGNGVNIPGLLFTHQFVTNNLIEAVAKADPNLDASALAQFRNQFDTKKTDVQTIASAFLISCTDQIKAEISGPCAPYSKIYTGDFRGNGELYHPCAAAPDAPWTLFYTPMAPQARVQLFKDAFQSSSGLNSVLSIAMSFRMGCTDSYIKAGPQDCGDSWSLVYTGTSAELPTPILPSQRKPVGSPAPETATFSICQVDPPAFASARFGESRV